MIKFKKRNVLIVLILLFIVSILMNAIYIFARQIKVSANVSSLSSNITLDDDFEDDCVLVVLDEAISRYKGVSQKISKNLFDVGAKKITELSSLPEEYLDGNGNIDAGIAPGLAEYYNENTFNQILRIDLVEKGKQCVLDAIERIAKLDGIASVEPNMIISYGEATTDDPYLSDQWGLVGSNGINVSDAWNITTGTKSVRVGVIDSGISDHLDLNDNVTSGYDFYNNNTLTTDDIGGHGTHVAGIIGAIGNNGRGVSGVAQNVTLVPLQTAYDTSGSGSHHTEDIVEAIDYARNSWDTNQRIPILNYSISQFGKNTTVLKAIKNFPGLFIWSAGNDREDVDTYISASGFNLPNLISVGAIDSNGNRRATSNYGENSVDIYAPGGSIYSTLPNNSYGNMSGTSMAAPHVTGVAALLLSVYPSLASSELKEIILNNADDITITIPNGNTQNVKKLNAFKAVKAIGPYKTNDAGDTITGINFIPSGGLVIPDQINGKTITAIGERAFYNCTELTSVTIPAGVTSIGDYAFTYCTQLEDVTFAPDCQLSSIGYQAFSYCSSLTKIQIPLCIFIGTNIEAQAFWGCTALTEVILPPNVTSIGDRAFENCSNLKSVIVYGQYYIATLGEGVFDGTPDTLTIYVADRLYDTYLATTNWSGYTANIERISQMNMFGDDYIYIVSLYGNDLFYSDVQITIGYDGERTFYAYGCMELVEIIADYGIPLSDVQEVYVYVAVDLEYTTAPGCALYDKFGNYMDWCEISDGLLCIPLISFPTNPMIEFYLTIEEEEELLILFGQEIYVVFVFMT